MKSSEPDDDLIDELIDLPLTEREAFLERICGTDTAMRQRLVGRLDELTDFLSSASLTGRPALARSSRENVAHALSFGLDVLEKPGTMIGRYALREKIGEGGCGVIYRAEQRHPVRREVALKLIKFGLDTREFLARFEAERQALALMEHPNIARVFDAGATETGRPYFVMELVRGIPITRFCDEHHLTTEDRLRLFISVCQGVQHAHQKGLIHRDLKPSNILVTRHDGPAVAGCPKIIDFGTAKTMHGRLTERTLLTRFEQFVGTPAYMSPEQLDMSGQDVDTRSDIYSLGVVLYELLSGQPPFDPKKFAEAGVDQIRQQIREVEPPRPSARLNTLTDEEQTTIAKLRGTARSNLSIILRGDLDWIVMQCIEKDRTRRYETANGLAMDIQRYLRNEPVIARPPSTVYLLQKAVRRHRVGFAATFAVATTLIVGTMISSWLAIRAMQAEREQIELRVRAESGEAAARLAAERQRQMAYVAEMNLARQSLAEGNLASARLLLEKYWPKTGEPDLRGFEWRYLWSQMRGDDVEILGKYIGRGNGFGGLAVSPDGRWIASSVAPNIEVRSHSTGERVQVLSNAGTSGNVGVLRFSPDGQWLVAVGIGRTRGLRAWRTEGWQTQASVEGPDAPFTFVDGGRALVARAGSRLSVWSTESWSKLDDLPGEISDSRYPLFLQAQAMACSPDGKTLFFGDSNHGIRTWDLDRRNEDAPIKLPFQAFVTSLAISPQGLMAAGHMNGCVTLWEARTRKLLDTFDTHRAWVTTVVFSPDGSLLASAGADQTILLWSVANRKLLRRFAGHEGEVWALAFTADGSELVSGSAYDATLRRWSLKSEPKATREIGADLPLAFVESSRALVCWSKENGIVQVDLATGRRSASEYARIPGMFARVDFNDTHVAPDLSVVALLRKGKVEIWSLQSGARQKILGDDGNITTLGFNREGTVLATAANEALITLWNTADWSAQELPHSLSNNVSARGIAFSHDGTLLAIQSEGVLRLFDLGGAKPHVVLPEKINQAMSVAFSPDDSKLVAGTTDNLIHVWDAQRREKIAILRGHLAGVFSVAFSPDGRTLASCGGNVVKLWSMETLQEIFTFPQLRAQTGWATFSPDGNFLAAGELFEDRVHVWHAPSWEEIKAAKKVQAAPLNQQ